MRNGQSECVDDYDVRIIVAGSRGYNDRRYFFEYMDGFHEDMVELYPGKKILYISGGAPTGADALMIVWCESRGHAYVVVNADWKNLEAPGAVIKINKRGAPYNAKAGMDRNEEMAKIATDIIVWWDLVSVGTRNMVKLGEKYKLIHTTVCIDITKE